MTSEDYKKKAETTWEEARNTSSEIKRREAMFYSQMGILEALLQMEICGHGTRGFCKDCMTKILNDKIIVRTRDWRD